MANGTPERPSSSLLARTFLWSALTIPLLAIVLSKACSSDPPREVLPPSNILEDHQIFSLSLPATYTTPSTNTEQYVRIPNSQPLTDTGRADTTAVLLNWSRLPNVRALVKLYCDPSLSDVFARVVLWNNSPRALRLKDFDCPKGKLNIINSPENLYFHARFLACSQAETVYCYTQDDDYIVRPEILRALHARAKADMPIHLLPPHEHLSSLLRTTRATGVHTSFAWLGHGTILPRASATSFLALLRALNASAEEAKMADNYWSVLSNALPELWFDQGIELDGGQPFTVGGEGHERNLRHVTRATEYLDTLLACDGPSCPIFPYVAAHTADSVTPTSCVSAACRGVACVFETNIRLLPADVPYTGTRARDMLELETRGRAALGAADQAHYLAHPPSAAVDGEPTTAFRSRQSARKGDYVALDLLASLTEVGGGKDVELVLLVPESTFPICMASSLQTSLDGVDWMTRHGTWRCVQSAVHSGNHGPSGEDKPMQECSVRSLDADAEHARWFRILLNDDVDVKWVLHEIWMREPKQP